MVKPSTYKGLFVSDIHMSNKLPYARPTKDDLTDRLEHQLALWKQVHKEAEVRDVDAIFILGDLFDKSLVDAVTLTHTVRAILEGNHDIYILPGNHDANSLRGGRFTVEAFGEMKNEHVKVIGKRGERLELGWLTFWPVAFKPIGETREELKLIRKQLDSDQVNVLLFHNSVLGARHLGWTCDDGIEPDELCEGFNWVISGHFHEHQVFGKDNTGMYLGAPMHHHYGDVGRDAYFWVMEFRSDGTRKAEPITGQAPRFHKADSLEAEHDAQPGDYLRFTLEATHAEWAKLRAAAREVCEALNAKGINADYKHKPIYHHKERIGKERKKATLTLDEAVAQYISTTGVVTTGLDVGRLRTIGREALEAARRSYGAA